MFPDPTGCLGIIVSLFEPMAIRIDRSERAYQFPAEIPVGTPAGSFRFEIIYVSLPI